MSMEKLQEVKLPKWWMILVEILLSVIAIYFICNGNYAEALLSIILLEIRDISWSMKTRANK